MCQGERPAAVGARVCVRVIHLLLVVSVCTRKRAPQLLAALCCTCASCLQMLVVSVYMRVRLEQLPFCMQHFIVKQLSLTHLN